MRSDDAVLEDFLKERGIGRVSAFALRCLDSFLGYADRWRAYTVLQHDLLTCNGNLDFIHGVALHENEQRAEQKRVLFGVDRSTYELWRGTRLPPERAAQDAIDALRYGAIGIRVNPSLPPDRAYLLQNQSRLLVSPQHMDAIRGALDDSRRSFPDVFRTEYLGRWRTDEDDE